MKILVDKLNATNEWIAEIEDDGHILAESTDGNFIINIICWNKKPIVRASLLCCFDRWSNAFYESEFNNYQEVFDAITNVEFKSEVTSEIVFTLLEEDRFKNTNKWLKKLLSLYEEYKESR